jgi:putative transferase (TIGR04331 family)
VRCDTQAPHQADEQHYGPGCSSIRVTFAADATVGSPALPTPATKLLVTTALEETWGEDEPIVFLGEWCKRYERRAVWSERHHETVPFHWDDRDKLRRDYAYLQSLHAALIRSLASSLNELHQVDQSTRYWQLLVDPWLMSFIAVVYDRWECLRVAFDQHGELATVVAADGVNPPPPFSSSEYLTHAPYGDEWNHALYRRIIDREHADRCVVRRREGLGGLAVPPAPSPGSVPARWTRRMAIQADRLIAACGFRGDVAFVDSYFSVPALVRLNLALGQMPRLFLREFGDGEASVRLPPAAPGVSLRARWRLRFAAASTFEAFLAAAITDYAPTAVVESYAGLRAWARRVAVRTRTIVTANAHWSHAHVKAWIAERVDAGATLVILEHGGSLPAYRELFDSEEAMADVKATWFLPYHVKHVQLPPSKLVPAFGRRRRRRRRAGQAAPYCVVIANENPRWVLRAQFYPMAGQCLATFEFALRFHAALAEPIQRAFRVKPQINFGWNTRQRYVDVLGAEHVLPPMRITRAFSLSRLIVCTYPETTFSEAMASGVPTILMYPEALYERHPVTDALLRILQAARIVFHDASAAAAHINANWDDLGRWWDSDTVRTAREEYHRQALRIDVDWPRQWTAFLRGVSA